MQLFHRHVKVNPIQDGGKVWGKAPTHTKFSPVTSPKVGVSLQIF